MSLEPVRRSTAAARRRVALGASLERKFMKLVIIESPYAGDVEENTRYARACLQDCLRRGEAPFASHLLYTQPGILDDRVPDERELGLEAGRRWGGDRKGVGAGRGGGG